MKRWCRWAAVGLMMALPAVAVVAAEWAALPEVAPAPKNNPPNEAKIELGKQLYFDPRLSLDGTISCNSCHNVMEGGDDDRLVSVGVGGRTGGRSAPTVWNAAFLSVQFWDGRAPSLEEQAKGPMLNPVEMAMPGHDVVIERIRSMPAYRSRFGAAFGGDGEITIDRVVQAIAAYERTLITPNSPYDRYVRGDRAALNEQQRRGMNHFAELGCTSCHSGPAFAGPRLPEGRGFFMKFPTYAGSEYETRYRLTEDAGRYEVTQHDADRHLWRVPTLRNIALTAPYFHNGSVKTLEEAVRVMARTQLNKTLTDQEVRDIVAFLQTLTGEFPEQTMPRLPAAPGTTVVP